MAGNKICSILFWNRPIERTRENYSYVKEGMGQGRRPELVGGGLIRSHGGWSEVKKLRRTGHARMKGDERMQGVYFAIGQ